MPEKLKAMTGQEIGAIVSPVVQRYYHELQPAWVERHLTLLCSLRRMFGNDIDKPIILGVIGQVMFAHSDPIGDGYDDVLDTTEESKYTQLTNIESISLATGIPRESVRRKVGELVDIGWIRRDERGRLLVTNKATKELDEASQNVFGLLADMYIRISKLLFEDDKAVLHSIDRIHSENEIN